ncbi:hypothetical protein AB0910_05190 [Streptomyces sp. NPDC047002]|uniref:DUF6924 domain-containing protein n=1 Tax=Streptomyces sp. NPDC047002 TaxID=3155475 RepID=UPI00345626D1
MALPALPQLPPGEIPWVCSCYEVGEARWGEQPDALAGGEEDGVLSLGAAGVRLRKVEDRGWERLSAGNIPALLPPGGPVPPVAVLTDIPALYGGDPLLVDLHKAPGRGVRVPGDRLGEVLAGLLDGTLDFDDLVRGMDRYGSYEGGGERPAFPTPAVAAPRAFPLLPAGEETLLVRTSFDDEDGWRALLAEFGGADGEGRVGVDLEWETDDMDDFPLYALSVDDRRFEGLGPGQVPAALPPLEPGTCDTVESTCLVLLADAGTFARPDGPLIAVDPFHTPGQSAAVPRRAAAGMACNLGIGNMDFSDFVATGDPAAFWL